MTISIVLYGRNDNYGYNLHKRAALSFNCMAEVLSDSSDEILFVDYNTPDDFPTFPEAIQDTLTKQARDKLRILRVRPRIHQRFRAKSHLVALEPIARNVAVRRSAPSNRWILSTNTDMIFVPRRDDSLSNVVRDLAPGFYHAPRIEIPELLWESFNRHAPAEVISTVREWGSSLHLNEIIVGSEITLYDGPGDFQLLLRDDLFANHGFHEGMLLGWHVDSNIAKRMHLKYGTTGDLRHGVSGYHCDHTRQVTAAHSHTRIQNDWRQFCDEVESPDIPEQADTWGCANELIEELRLISNPASIYVRALQQAVGSPLAEAALNKYSHETYNHADYDPRHMVPFLTDMFVSMPRSCNLAWYGARKETLTRFAAVWEELGFTERIHVDPELIHGNDLPEAVVLDLRPDSLDRADTLVFDFGGLPGLPDDIVGRKVSEQLTRNFMEVVHEERRRLSSGAPCRRVIALNAINNRFERLVGSFIAAAITPCATHMRHGFVLPAQSKDDWLPIVHVGKAGFRVGKYITSDARKLGDLAYGPYKSMESGDYRLTVKIELAPDERDRVTNEPCIVIQIQAGAQVFNAFPLSRATLVKPDHEFPFSVPQTALGLVADIETRISLLSHVSLSIQAIVIGLISTSSHQIDSLAPVLSPSFALKIDNWLPHLRIGPLGRVDDSDVIAQKGPSDVVVFGPYWPLPTGHYEAVISIESQCEAPCVNPMIRADVMTGDQQLVAADFHLDALGTLSAIRLPFEISGNSSEWRQIETRIWSSGEERFRIRTLSVKPLEHTVRLDLMPYLFLGAAGRRTASGICNVKGSTGVIAYSPNIRIKTGYYRMAFVTEVEGLDDEANQACALAFVKCGIEILEAKEIMSAAGQIKKQELAFEVTSTSRDHSAIEFYFQAVDSTNANITVHNLTIEPIATTPERRHSAVLLIRDWLPFLKRGKSAHAGVSGIDVTEGVEEFALYGPFWTLPAGDYEMRVLVVPNPVGRNHRNALVTAQVTAEQGTSLFAEAKWSLSQYELAEAGAAVEFRLPFSLSENLSAAARTIETRVFTPGNANFRILSLKVTPKKDKPESNWFPYLLAGECGVHTVNEIRTAKGKLGYVAHTPRIPVAAGHYRLSLNIAFAGHNNSEEDTVAIEAWSGSDLIAIGTFKSGSVLPMELSAAETQLELRVRAIAPADFLVRGLIFEKRSDQLEPGTLPAVLKVKNWLPFLQIGLAACRTAQGVLAARGSNGIVVHGPQWPIAPGNYVMLIAVELDKNDRVRIKSPSDIKNLVKTSLSFTSLFPDGGVDVRLDGTQIALLDRFTLGAPFSRSVLLQLPFEVTPTDARSKRQILEVRIWSRGRRSFSLRSLMVTEESRPLPIFSPNKPSP